MRLAFLTGVLAACIGALLGHQAAPWMPSFSDPFPWGLLAILALISSPAAAAANRLFSMGDKIIATDQVALRKRFKLEHEVQLMCGVAWAVILLLALAGFAVVTTIFLATSGSLASDWVWGSFVSFVFVVAVSTAISISWNTSAMKLISRLEYEKQRSAHNAALGQRLKNA